MGQKKRPGEIAVIVFVLCCVVLPLISGCDDIVEWLEPTVTPTESLPATTKVSPTPRVTPTPKATPKPTTAATTLSTPTPTPKTSPQPTPTLVTSPAPDASTIQPILQSTAIIERHYKWEYGGSEWTYTTSIPQSWYDYYAGLPRPPTRNYSVYVTHPEDDPFIEHLIESFEDAATEKGYNEFQTVNFIVRFVQSLPYTSDDVTKGFDEYPRYPIETLVDNGGDCEDTSILMAAILHQMGYGTILINPPNHMAVGVLGGERVYGTSWTLNGSKYYYLETTSEGRQLGELPSEYQGAKALLYELVPVPILTDDWDSVEATFIFPRWYYKLEVTVKNQGTATASDLYVQVAFDAGNDQVWNPENSPAFGLAPGYNQTVTMYIAIPRNEHTRLIVSTVQDGIAVLRSYSKWFDT